MSGFLPCVPSIHPDGAYISRKVGIPNDISEENLSSPPRSGLPIGVAQCEIEKYLVCYPGLFLVLHTTRRVADKGSIEFGAFVHPRRGFLDEEEDDERVTWNFPATQAVFQWPYALLFSHSRIEIRHICTGSLIQIIEGIGTGLRCIWSSPIDQTGVFCVANDVPAGVLPSHQSNFGGSGCKMFEITSLFPATGSSGPSHIPNNTSSWS